MRIISKTTDYYDPIQRIGYDPKLIYKRKTKVVGDPAIKELIERKTENIYKKPIMFRLSHGHLNLDANSMIVGVAGKVYPCIRISTNYDIHKEKEIIVYSYSEYIDTVASLVDIPAVGKIPGIKKFIQRISKKAEITRPKYTWRISPSQRAKLFFNSLKGDNTDYSEIFRKLHSPVFMVDFEKELYLVKDPNLAELNFFKIMDAYTCYQEIAMYLSGVLGVGNPQPIGIDDVAMRDKKGFDGMSFKTTSPGKKRKRRKNG